METEITIPKAAKRLGVSARTAQLWARSGRLKAREFGGMYWVRPSDLAKIVRPKRGRPVSTDK